MKIFAISDLHLTTSTNKPMDMFGENWVGHWQKITEDWEKKVTDNDVVLLSGDTSWAMKLDEVKSDLELIGSLKGTKFIIRGNHDYWWSSYRKIQDIAPSSIKFIQNNAIKIGDTIICGTRGWTVPENEQDQSAEDKKIYDREIIRLKLSLECAKALQTNSEKIILLIHYPPFNSRFANSPFTDIIKDFQVKQVVYGHLHGNKSRYKTVVTKGDVTYFLTSCDVIDNTLIEL